MSGKLLWARKGVAVVIRRDDGTEFFSSSEKGIQTPVWPTGQRRYAVAHKKDLRAHGFKARVVEVEFADVVLATPTKGEG